jgi:hypothetical protein
VLDGSSVSRYELHSGCSTVATLIPRAELQKAVVYNNLKCFFQKRSEIQSDVLDFIGVSGSALGIRRATAVAIAAFKGKEFSGCHPWGDWV